MPSRRLVHARQIRLDVYARDDGLWDVDAVLIDTKTRDFALASGVRPAGEPMHDMTLKVTIDTRCNIVAATAHSQRVPYPGYCDTIGPAYQKLVGLNLLDDFRTHLRARLGGVHGCAHLTELAAALPTAALQGFAGEVYPTRDSSQQHGGVAAEKPWQLDRCHALRSSSEAVAKYYPDWYQKQRHARKTPA
jgi:hypothetical protein